MSISIVLRNKKVTNKKGKKITISDGEEVKQFRFQEDTWEFIKEFLITNRSKLLLKMKKLSIPRLCDIYRVYFKRRFTNMKSSAIPLEERRKLITTGIIDQCEKLEKYALIMEKEFQVEPKNHEWVKDFVVGEEVIINTSKYSRHSHRKAIITRIGKTISVDVYDYNVVKVCNDHQRYFTSKIIYKQNIKSSVIARDRCDIYKRGENNDKYFDDFTYDW